MIFNSFEFLWLFPIIFVVYYGVTMRDKLVTHFPRHCVGSSNFGTL